MTTLTQCISGQTKQTVTTDAQTACCTWPTTRNISNGSCGGNAKSGVETYGQILQMPANSSCGVNGTCCTYAIDNSAPVNATTCVCKDPTTQTDPAAAIFNQIYPRGFAGPSCPPGGSSSTKPSGDPDSTAYKLAQLKYDRYWMVNQNSCRTYTNDFPNLCDTYAGTSPTYYRKGDGTCILPGGGLACNTSHANYRSSATEPETGSCQTASYKWTVVSGTSTDEGYYASIAGIPKENDACSPSTPYGNGSTPYVDVEECYRASGGGGEKFSNCQCAKANNPGCSATFSGSSTTYTHPCTLVDIPNHPELGQACKECTLDITTYATGTPTAAQLQQLKNNVQACQPN